MDSENLFSGSVLKLLKDCGKSQINFMKKPKAFIGTICKFKEKRV